MIYVCSLAWGTKVGKENARHWRNLEGHASIDNLFEDLPPLSTVLDYLNFPYHIGEQSLPEAFVRIANRFQQGESGQMLKKGNTVYCLLRREADSASSRRPYAS